MNAIDVKDEGLELEEAEARMRRLEREIAEIPEQLSAAARLADASALLRLRVRRDEAQAELFAARSTLLRLRISAGERRRTQLRLELEERESELAVAAEAARRAADAAREKLKEHSAIVFEVSRVQNALDLERRSLNELREELRTEIANASGETGPGAESFGIRTGERLFTWRSV
jgi:hypothetical protein